MAGEAPNRSGANELEVAGKNEENSSADDTDEHRLRKKVSSNAAEPHFL